MNNPEINGTKIPPFLAAKNLEPYVTKDVLERTKLIEYQDGTSKEFWLNIQKEYDGND